MGGVYLSTALNNRPPNLIAINEFVIILIKSDKEYFRRVQDKSIYK